MLYSMVVILRGDQIFVDFISFSSISYMLLLFLNQAHVCRSVPGFLELLLSTNVVMLVCVCVCVSAPEAISN